MVILGTGIFGFGFFFLTRSPSMLDYDHELVGPVWPFVSVFLLALGHFDAATYDDLLSLIVLIVALLFSGVLLLNLLIAIMGDSYEMVKESEVVEKLAGRARLVVEHERLQPTANVFPRFLHVLRATEGGGGGEAPVWEGIAGKVRQEVAVLRKSMSTNQEVERIKQEVHGVDQKVEGVDKKVEAMKQ